MIPPSEVFRADHLRLALEAAVRIGHDTDTVAAIAGGLLGAVYGASAVPSRWRLALNGWPGLTTRGLVQLATKIIRKGRHEEVRLPYGGTPKPANPSGIPTTTRCGSAASPLCGSCPRKWTRSCRCAGSKTWTCPRVCNSSMSASSTKRVRNAHLDFVLLDTVRAIEQLRAEGRTVFVHCVQAYSRTPTIGALYGARKQGVDIDQALRDVAAVLPGANPNPDFRAALRRLHPKSGGAS